MRKVTVYSPEGFTIATFYVPVNRSNCAVVMGVYSHAAAQGYAVGKVSIENAALCDTVRLIGMLWLLVTLLLVCGAIYAITIPQLSGNELVGIAISMACFITASTLQAASKLLK